MADPVLSWRTEHEYFRRLLALLQAQLDVFHRGERPNYELMLDIIAYLREYGDAYHHPREDMAFSLLAARRPELDLPLARLHQEHRVIKRAGEKLEELLNEALDGALVKRAEVEVAAATYLVYYGNHIAREEEKILAAAEAALTPEDWDAVGRAVPAKADLLSAAGPQERYRELARRLAS
jgi:hemerythrin-like domain-containing protein